MDNNAPAYNLNVATNAQHIDNFGVIKLGPAGGEKPKRKKKTPEQITKAVNSPSENRDDSKIAIKKTIQSRHKDG